MDAIHRVGPNGGEADSTGCQRVSGGVGQGRSDPAATAANIMGNTGLFRLGFMLYLVEMAAQIVMTALFYQLLKPVHRGVALLSTAFGLVGCTIKIVARLFYIMPLLVLGAHSKQGPADEL